MYLLKTRSQTPTFGVGHQSPNPSKIFESHLGPEIFQRSRDLKHLFSINHVPTLVIQSWGFAHWWDSPSVCWLSLS